MSPLFHLFKQQPFAKVSARWLKKWLHWLTPFSSNRESLIQRPLLAVVAVFIGTFMSSFYTRLVSQGLADLRGVYGLSMEEGAWLTTSINAPQLLLAPLIPFLAIAIGCRTLLLSGALLFTLLLLLIPTAETYCVLLGLHIGTGLLLGVFIPATLIVVLRNLPPRWWLIALGVYGLRIIITLNFSPVLIDLYIGQLGWQWIYWQTALLAILMGVVVYYSIPHESLNRVMLKQADWTGMMLFCSAFMLLYLALDGGYRFNWLESPFVLFSLLGAVLLFGYFLLHEWRIPHPWAPISVILSRNIFLCCLLGLLYGLVSMASALLIPHFLVNVAGFRGVQVGQLLLWGVYIQPVVLPLTIYIIRRISARYTLIFGLVCFAIACLMTTLLTAEWRFTEFLPVVLLMSTGHAFTFLSIISLGVANTYVPKLTSILAYIQAFRIVTPMVGVSVLLSFFGSREQLYFIGLMQQQSVNDLPSVSVISQGQEIENISIFSKMASQEAAVLAYIDAFYVCFAATLLALIIVAFLKPSPSNPMTPN